jgi:hypothetical protein
MKQMVWWQSFSLLPPLISQPITSPEFVTNNGMMALMVALEVVV